MIAPRTPRPSGMTLTELLVVMAIIMLLSAATLPAAYVAFAEREVSEAASMVQANLALTRDRATGSGQAQGVRFLPDPDLTDPFTGRIASSRMVALTTPPNYTEGLVIPVVEIFTNAAGDEIARRLAVYGAKIDGDGVPVAPTAWYFNIRQGETIRIGGTGNEFTIAGPITIGPLANPERFVNRTENGQTTGTPVRALPSYADPEYEILYLVNGRDDDGDGYTDPHFDGIDNNGDDVVDPGYDGIDNNGNQLVDEIAELLLEYERDEPILDKAFLYARVNNRLFNGVPELIPLDDFPDLTRRRPITDTSNPIAPLPYVISRRPSVAIDAREYALPNGAVIDLTTSSLRAASERSRVPIDPITGYVDLMIYPNGLVVPSTPWGFKQAMDPAYPLYFFWIASREDVHPPTDPDPSTPAIEPVWPVLPLPPDLGQTAPPFLQGERRIVTLSPNSGYASVSEIPEFGVVTPNMTAAERAVQREIPYAEARLHQRTGR